MPKGSQGYFTSSDTGTALLGTIRIDAVWDLEKDFMQAAYEPEELALYNSVTKRYSERTLKNLLEKTIDKKSIFYNVPHQIFSRADYKVADLEKIKVRVHTSRQESGEKISEKLFTVGKKLTIALEDKENGLQGTLIFVSNPLLKEHYEEVTILKQGARCTCVVPFDLRVKVFENNSGGFLYETQPAQNLLEVFKELDVYGIEDPRCMKK
ncbi:MAG: hypothetical protein PHU12_00015 [Candidatus Aenigmarchaeota archaeon]|nr:hypothetical protein [Candidatus Aenigmarchaeota archaeon]